MMQGPGGTAIAPSPPNRWLRVVAILGVAISVLVVAAIVAIKVVYPRVAEKKLRAKLTEKIASKLGRTATVGAIEVRYGHATIHNLEIANPSGGASLAKVRQIDLEFSGWKSLFGSVELGDAEVDGVTIALVRNADGTDNFTDIVERMRSEKSAAEPNKSDRFLPTQITVKKITASARDEQRGVNATVADADAVWTKTNVRATLRQSVIANAHGSLAEAEQVFVQRVSGHAPVAQISGGELFLTPKLALSSVAGTVSIDEEVKSRVRLDVSGGYDGVDGQLWTARGWLDPRSITGSIDVDASKFRLDRLSAFLDNAKLVDYEKTSIDANLHLEITRDGATFAGKTHVADLTVGHPMLADRDVRGLGIDGKVAGQVSRIAKRVQLTQGEFVSRGLPFSVKGEIGLAGGIDDNGVARPARVAKGEIVIPDVPCQTVLDAIPSEMAPYLKGYQLSGTFRTRIEVAINWADLDATKLSGSIPIRNCKAVQRPSDSPARLRGDFEHYVEVGQGEWLSFDVSEDNPEFVPLAEISPYLISSIMSTEDSAFRSHHGFIPSEFRTALVNNLKAGGFRYGASSITMQMVKNVLLYRKKTLARKLQELFLTWDVENVLSKDRIMEIYLNVIEYGPGLYGIGPAALHYFGKPAKELTPTEAAFFSSILPSPKLRYKQYCDGTLSKWTEGKISRILGIMNKRGRLTQAEYDAAIATPLTFAKDGSESDEECRERQAHAVRNARSTNPMEK